MADPDDLQKVVDDQKIANEAKKSSEDMIAHLDAINKSVEEGSLVSKIGIGMLLDNFKTAFTHTQKTDEKKIAVIRKHDDKFYSDLIKANNERTEAETGNSELLENFLGVSLAALVYGFFFSYPLS